MTHFRLTKMDEFPRHQLGMTFDVVGSSSPHWSDGYYFTLGDNQGEMAFFVGLRLYANNDVMDAFTCISTDGKQHNMRYSRRLRPRIDDLECGAMSLEIIEGLKTLRLQAKDNPYGITYDLLWEGFTPPYNEEHIRHFASGRLLSERSNYDQACNVSGWIQIGDKRWEVTREGWVGVRDHSWGVGPTGGPPTRAAAPPVIKPEPFGMRQWALFRLPERMLFYQFHRNRHGELTKFESQVMYPYGSDKESWAYTSIEDELEFAHGERRERRLKEGEIRLLREDGSYERFKLETISLPVYLEGGGYWRGFNDGLGRGVYRGEDIHEGEVWDVSHPTRVIDPTGKFRFRSDHWAETWGRLTNLDNPEETGSGHLECVISGPYPGFVNEEDE
ncbi:MAG: hypothetical protein AAF512_00300 [Pseudomonadota bacterium]